ncbi:histone H1-like [Neodiprion lecontei]|uniref:Histone H1-like n=1 Tax=Neodiprion lecontei TaxID=441921 RepID=A0A6J0B5A9_NEOLC|nr:histone H1-like [Neodiprion lecontei]
MADKVASPVAAATPTSPAVQAKKGAAALKSQKPRTKPAHPRTSEMVNSAISTLKERGGSSLQAIKKYISATYKIDGEKQAPFIKKYLKAAVSTGALVQTKGKGASGSFKISATKSETSKPKVKPAAPKPTVLKKKAAPSAVSSNKKVSAAKKAAAAKKTGAASSVVTKEKRQVARSPAAKPPKAKSSSKAKKVAKAPTSKPKAPKPKKATAAPKTAKLAPKKAAAPKKK